MISNAAFLGSKKFGFNLFKTLFESDTSINWTVLCPPDHEDLRTYYSKFNDFTKTNNIDLITAVSSKMVAEYAIEHDPDIMIVCGYYRILPTKLLNSISMGVWGIHNSLLPKYRGGSPLVWQIINQEEVLGSSFFKFSDGIDDGLILDQVQISNCANLSISEASDQIEQEWINRIPSLWKDLCNGKVKPYEQLHKDATFCAQRQESDGLIDWKMTASQIDAFIRAQAHPYPRAFFRISKKYVKVVKHKLDPRVIYGTVGQVYEVCNEYVTICCGNSTAIRLYEVESGGKVLMAKDLLVSIKNLLN